ncbi:Rha family phage regulatory protein [Methylobacterium fujisawaense]|uniref:Rha family phage regulatory protein n=1 Tax=Methylobacterium fujisawaense TaxID=107400 RepID=A0ABR6DAN4_9HYPH|nr:Rha family phage regulatory protein [Methylobacterium fujisawaense]
MTAPALASSPVVAVIDGAAVADSRDVAALFEKNHRDVLRSIDALLSSGVALPPRSFAQGGYTRPDTGQQQHRRFLMDRDGFALLAMGFTGARALAFKLAYIAAFNAMEAGLRGSARIDVRDPSQLALIAGQLVELNRELTARAEAAERAVEAAAPKLAFVDRFVAADGLYGLQNAARALGQPPNGFIDRLKRDVLFYQGGSLVPRALFANRGLFIVKPVLNGERARYQTFVTAKGLHWLADRLRAPALPPPSPGDLFAAGAVG